MLSLEASAREKQYPAFLAHLKASNMNKDHSIAAIYPSHTAAEAAVKELQQSGFDMKTLEHNEAAHRGLAMQTR